jgi:hypothetical protein
VSGCGIAVASSWDRLHPRLTHRTCWLDHHGELPIIEGTLIRLKVDHLPGDRDPKPVWLWSSRTGATAADVDRWTWPVIACHTQLRLARPLADDLRRPWERPAAPGRLTPARVRHGFQNIHARTTIRLVRQNPASPAPDAHPSPGTATRSPPPRREDELTAALMLCEGPAMSTTRRPSPQDQHATREARRLRGAGLSAQGRTQAEVASELGVSHQSVHVWHARSEQIGVDVLRGGDHPAHRGPGMPAGYGARH